MYVCWVCKLAMTLLSFLRSLTTGLQLIQMNFLYFWPGFKLSATLSFLSHVLTRLFCTLSFCFWYWSRSNQLKMLFCIFSLSSATHFSLSPSNKGATFPFILLFFFFFGIFEGHFLVPLCSQFISYISFFALFFCFSGPLSFHLVLFSFLKKKITPKKIIVSGEMHCLQQWIAHGKQ